MTMPGFALGFFAGTVLTTLLIIGFSILADRFDKKKKK